MRNYDSIVVPVIGKEEAETGGYVKLIFDLFEMAKVHKEYFLNMVEKEPQKIHMILGLRGQESLLTTIRAKKLETFIHGSCLIYPYKGVP